MAVRGADDGGAVTAAAMPTTDGSHRSNPRTIHVRVEWAVDWMLRCWLPHMLDAVGDPRSACALRDLSEVTRDAVANRYALLEASRLLRNVRSRLREALHCELRFARTNGIPIHQLTDESALPHLEEISRHAARSSHIGRLIRICTQLALAVILARQANDSDGEPSRCIPDELTATYEREFLLLVRACRPAP